MTAVVFTQEVQDDYSDNPSYRSPVAVMTSRNGESDKDFYERVRTEAGKLTEAQSPAGMGMPARAMYSDIEWNTVEHLDVFEVSPTAPSP